MKPIRLLCTFGSAVLLAAVTALGDVRQGLVSYWPLDVISEDWTTTPDVVSGNNFVLMGIDPSALVDGKRGKAMQFDGSTQYAYYTAAPGADTGLPISRAAVWTVACWVKGAPKQSDRRVFSESNSGDFNNNPLVNIGTHNTGADGTVDLYFRNSTGGVQINHAHSPGTAYDNTWHHVALVDEYGKVTLYIDGQVNMTTTYTRSAPAQDTTSIGAIVRGGGGSISAYFNGAIDEVAAWDRALTPEEIQEVMNNGIQTPVPSSPPSITMNPAGATNLYIGDSITLLAGASGTHPLNYQWLKNDTPIPDAVSPTLVLTNLQPADSGQYALRVSNASGTATSAPATITVSDWAAPNLTNRVVAYWPLDEIQGSKTPDIVSGYDMDLVNLTAADLVAGKWGKCFTFDLARQTMLTRVHSAGEALPIYQHPNFSVSLWVKGDIQTDKRVFSEGSTKSTQPLFCIGTHNTGADGTVDSYIRTDGGATSGDHRHSTGIAFDGTWHHILYTQREVAGAMTARFYIDGVEDDVVLGPVRPLSMNTTAIGGILRATPAAWFTGQIDDVIVWDRALSPAEAQLLATAPMPTPPPNLQPLKINLFKAELPQIVQGDSVMLRWDVSKTATEILIDNGVGDVTAKTVGGVASVSVSPATTTKYTLTIKRGTDELTAQATVHVLSGVAANWAVLDTFDEYPLGPIADTGWWSDLRGQFARVEDFNGNRMLSMMSTDSAAVLPIGPLKITEGQERTLFFRMIARGDPTAALRQVVGLTDKNIRWHGDTTGNVGPVLNLSYDPANPGWFVGVINGVGGVLENAPDALEKDAVYSVWINIKNVPMNDPASPYDTFSVYIQKRGEAQRKELFVDYSSDRDPFNPDPVLGMMMPNLDKLFVAGNNTTHSALFDDFFVSKSGFNATEPIPFSEGTPPTLSVGLVAGQVEVSWSGGSLESATSINGPWEKVTGATSSPYRVTPTGAQMYFRAVR